MAEINTSDEFAVFYEGLDAQQKNAVHDIVELLAEFGLALPFPYSSDIKGTRYPLRELRKSAGRHEMRVIYAFDPKRDAYLILGGDKSGDDRFYEREIPKAEAIWEKYLKEIGAWKKQ